MPYDMTRRPCPICRDTDEVCYHVPGEYVGLRRPVVAPWPDATPGEVATLAAAIARLEARIAELERREEMSGRP